MPRAPRKFLSDGLVHAYTRGNRYDPIFLTEGDAYEFVWRATDALERHNVECWSYCLMPTHYHLVLSGRRVDI